MPKKNAFLFLLLFFFYACSQEENPKPNIVIFIADDVSWDDFGCYGNKAVATPNIDALAKNGLVFNNAFLTASSCSPSRVSIMSGRYPHNTGAPELHMPLPEGIPTIGTQLKATNYFVGASGKWHMGEVAKTDFDIVLDKDFGQGGEGKWIDLLNMTPKDKPFFLWLASIDAHRDWGENRFENTTVLEAIEIPSYMRDDSITRADLKHYYDEIARFDYHIGEIIKALKLKGQYENTIIVVMADNGRPFPRDKTRLYDSGIKTPFIISWKAGGVHAGQTCNALVSVIDIAPTLAELSGGAKIESYQGRSFARLLRTPELEHRKFVFAEHNWHDYAAHERMVRSKDYLYIENALPSKRMSSAADVHSGAAFQSLVQSYRNNALSDEQLENFMQPRPSAEFYDCRKDALQLHNLIEHQDYKDVIAQMRTALADWGSRSGDHIPNRLTPDRYDFFTARSKDTTKHFLDVDRMEVAGEVHRATHITGDQLGF